MTGGASFIGSQLVEKLGSLGSTVTVVDGLILSAANITDGSSINVGTDEITTVVDAAKIICEIVNYAPSEIFFDTTKPECVTARAASVVKASEFLQWPPTVSFAEGIKQTIDWYSSHVDLDELRNSFERKLLERG